MHHLPENTFSFASTRNNEISIRTSPLIELFRMKNVGHENYSHSNFDIADILRTPSHIQKIVVRVAFLILSTERVLSKCKIQMIILKFHLRPPNANPFTSFSMCICVLISRKSGSLAPWTIGNIVWSSGLSCADRHLSSHRLVLQCVDYFTKIK